jgi:hypothetical protein
MHDLAQRALKLIIKLQDVFKKALEGGKVIGLKENSATAIRE